MCQQIAPLNNTESSKTYAKVALTAWIQQIIKWRQLSYLCQHAIYTGGGTSKIYSSFVLFDEEPFILKRFIKNQPY